MYAVVDADDADHRVALDLLQRRDLQLVIPTLVVAEATYLVGSRLGSRTEAAFLRGLAQLHVQAPSVEDWNVIATYVDQYADFPLGGTDASVVALAARLETDLVITLDRPHFSSGAPTTLRTSSAASRLTHLPAPSHVRNASRLPLRSA